MIRIAKVITITSLVILLLPFAFLLHPSVAGYWLREVSYEHIADRIKQKSSTQRDQVELATGFFFLNEADPKPPFPIVDHTVHTDLIRGLGRCDQRVNGLLTVLDKLGVDGRFLIFDCHTIAEVYAGNETLLVDPTENVVWQEALKDASESFSWNTTEWQAVAFDSEVVENYRYASISKCGNARTNDVLRNRKTLSRKALDNVIAAYCHIVGHKFLHSTLEWLDFLGHLEDKELYGAVLNETELSMDIDRKARAFELLELQDCHSILPCFWSFKLAAKQDRATEFIWARRSAKRVLLTDFQKQLFVD